MERKFLNSDGQQFHLSINKTNINNHLLHQIIEHQKKTTTYDVGNPGPGLGQAQKCGGIKLFFFNPKPLNLDN